jgi:hypothetical protein
VPRNKIRAAVQIGRQARARAAPVITGSRFHDPREYRDFWHFVATLCNVSQSR